MNNKRFLRVVVSAALLGTMVWFVLPKLPDLSEVWGSIRAMTGAELAILAVVAGWNLVTYWIATLAASPELSFRQAMVVKTSATAVSNAVPGGSAISLGLSYAMLGSWGFSRSKSSVSLAVGGLWNNFVKLGMPVLALGLLAFTGDASGSRVAGGIAGLAILVAAVTLFALLLRSEAFAHRAGEAAGRLASRGLVLAHRAPVSGWGHATTTFRTRVIGLVRQSWLRLTVSAVVSNLSLFAVLLLTLRHIGVSDNEVGWMQVVAVFSFVRLITAVPLMPGGLGLVELGLISGLTSAGGDEAQVVAAVLVFRLVTYLVPIVLGLGTYVYWRRNTSWRRVAVTPALALRPNLAIDCSYPPIGG